jgi:hypothetical protein
MRQQARNQRHALLQGPVVIAAVRAHRDAVIAELEQHLAELEAEIGPVMAAGAWADEANLLLSITGIGRVTTAWLRVGTVNFQAWASADSASASVG